MQYLVQMYIGFVYSYNVWLKLNHLLHAETYVILVGRISLHTNQEAL